MAVKLYDAGTEDGLFNVQGKAFHAQNTINTARGTTMPTEINDVFTIFNNLTVDEDLEEVVAALGPAANSVKAEAGGQMGQLTTFVGNLLIEMVDDDNPQPTKALKTALVEIISQMESSGDSVDASTVTVAVAAASGNTGDGVVLLSIKRGDGLIQESIIAETIEVEATNNGLTANVNFLGELSASLLSAVWPLGSSAGKSVSAVDASGSLLLNGDMEDEDNVPNQPDDWIVSVGTIGTTVKMTDVEVQTVAITGTPTGGHYLLSWVNPDSITQTTEPLAFNASASAVQTALRKLTGLSLITVSAAGTSPDFTHTVTFSGKGGNLNELTSTNNLTGGTPVITHATTTQGTAQVFAGGKALELDSDGAELTTLYQRLTGLEPETAYAISLWAIADVVPAAGVITLQLSEGITGATIQDAQGMLNRLSFNAANLTTAWQHLDALVVAVNEVQRVTITGTPTGGTFTLTYDGQTTAGIAYDATAATVDVALEALSNIDAGDVAATGGPLPGTAVDVEFTGRLAARNVPVMSADDAGLTGGASPAVIITTETQGSPNELVFRTPAVVPDVVYLRIRISVAVSAGTSVFLDHVALAKMTALYPAGPLVAMFAGSKDFKKGDQWTVTTTTDRAGMIQEMYERNFAMAAKGLLLPSKDNGLETIPDTVVA